jgi:putative endonuclease
MGVRQSLRADSVRFPCRNVHSSQTAMAHICHPEPRQYQRRREPRREGPMYFVYIMTNRSKTLYTGVTNNLMRRVREHKSGAGSGFTAKYKLDRLVYFERFEDVHNAIEREKRIKGWLRIKKIALIVSVNPSWKDLSGEWYERHQYQPQSA